MRLSAIAGIAAAVCISTAAEAATLYTATWTGEAAVIIPAADLTTFTLAATYDVDHPSHTVDANNDQIGGTAAFTSVVLTLDGYGVFEFTGHFFGMSLHIPGTSLTLLGGEPLVSSLFIGSSSPSLTFISVPIGPVATTGTGNVVFTNEVDAVFDATLTPTTLQIAAVAVPEPATWALMIGGFGVAGAMLRRTRRARLTG